MPKRASNESPSKLIFRGPLEELAAELRDDADRWRERPGNQDVAEAYERAAARVEERVEQAAHGEWVLTEDAAPLLKITPDAVRARCRRSWARAGKAEKRGGIWYVHTDALNAA